MTGTAKEFPESSHESPENKGPSVPSRRVVSNTTPSPRWPLATVAVVANHQGCLTRPRSQPSRGRPTTTTTRRRAVLSSPREPPQPSQPSGTFDDTTLKPTTTAGGRPCHHDYHVNKDVPSPEVEQDHDNAAADENLEDDDEDDKKDVTEHENRTMYSPSLGIEPPVHISNHGEDAMNNLAPSLAWIHSFVSPVVIGAVPNGTSNEESENNHDTAVVLQNTPGAVVVLQGAYGFHDDDDDEYSEESDSDDEDEPEDEMHLDMEASLIEEEEYEDSLLYQWVNADARGGSNHPSFISSIYDLDSQEDDLEQEWMNYLESSNHDDVPEEEEEEEEIIFEKVVDFRPAPSLNAGSDEEESENKEEEIYGTPLQTPVELPRPPQSSQRPKDSFLGKGSTSTSDYGPQRKPRSARQSPRTEQDDVDLNNFLEYLRQKSLKDDSIDLTIRSSPTVFPDANLPETGASWDDFDSRSNLTDLGQADANVGRRRRRPQNQKWDNYSPLFLDHSSPLFSPSGMLSDTDRDAVISPQYCDGHPASDWGSLNEPESQSCKAASPESVAGMLSDAPSCHKSPLKTFVPSPLSGNCPTPDCNVSPESSKSASTPDVGFCPTEVIKINERSILSTVPESTRFSPRTQLQHQVNQLLFEKEVVTQKLKKTKSFEARVAPCRDTFEKVGVPGEDCVRI